VSNSRKPKPAHICQAKGCDQPHTVREYFGGAPWDLCAACCTKWYAKYGRTSPGRHDCTGPCKSPQSHGFNLVVGVDV